MKIRKWIAFGLVSIQFATVSSFGATVQGADDLAAESTLIYSVKSIQGMSLGTQKESQKQIQDALLQYDQASPQEGRIDRLFRVEVAMNILTQAEAQQKEAFVNQQIARLQERGKISLQDVQNTLQETLKSSQGAQFSGCDREIAIGSAIAVAGLAGIIVSGFKIHSEDKPSGGQFNFSVGTAVGLLGSIIALVAGLAATADCD